MNTPQPKSRLLEKSLAVALAALAISSGALARDAVGLPVFITTTITHTTFQGDAFNSVFTGGGQLDLATGEVQFAGVETFNGGTGRFRNATGNAADMGEADTVAAHGSFTSTGAIRY